MTGKLALIASRCIEAALLLLGITVFFAEFDKMTFLLLGWDALALLYLGIRIVRLRRSGRGAATSWLTHGLGGRAGLAFTVFTSIVGIMAGLSIVLSKDADAKSLASVVGVPAVLFAWAILHFGYAERYAKTFYGGAQHDRGLAFPNTDEPSFVEFAYFSFTLGTTFSVSDVETRTSAMRLQILSHSILSFIYNTVTIGIAVSIISG